jgi:hypothetical protein
MARIGIADFILRHVIAAYYVLRRFSSFVTEAGTHEFSLLIIGVLKHVKCTNFGPVTHQSSLVRVAFQKHVKC